MGMTIRPVCTIAFPAQTVPPAGRRGPPPGMGCHQQRWPDRAASMQARPRSGHSLRRPGSLLAAFWRDRIRGADRGAAISGSPLEISTAAESRAEAAAGPHRQTETCRSTKRIHKARDASVGFHGKSAKCRSEPSRSIRQSRRAGLRQRLGGARQVIPRDGSLRAPAPQPTQSSSPGRALA